MTNEEFAKQNYRVQRAQELTKMINALEREIKENLTTDNFTVHGLKSHCLLTVNVNDVQKKLCSADYIKSFRARMRDMLIQLMKDQVEEYKKEFEAL